MSLRDRQKMQTREHLLDTAGVLFGEKGYTATSIDDIIGAAGASRATLYAYFDSKEALLSAIVERMWVEAQAYYDDFGALPDWSHESIFGWMQRFAAAWLRDAPRNQAAVAASPALMLDNADSIEWHSREGAAIRANAALWVHLTETEANLRAAMIVDVIEGQFSDFFFKSSPLDLELDEFLGLVTEAVRDLLKVA